MLFDEPERAAESLAKSVSFYEQGSNYYVWAPNLDPVRDSPQMQDLLRRLNLEGVQIQRMPTDKASAP
jgi:hypothetical protein